MQNQGISPGLRARVAQEKHGFSFTHSLGQNFILDDDFLEEIALEAGVGEGEVVLEIGPGPGLLTHHLASHCRKVLALEIDRKLEPVLAEALEAARAEFDYIFIDCPPSLELLTLNALCAADGILVPVQCEYYALEGLSDLMTTLRAVKRGLNPSLSIFGVLLTMYDGRTNFSAQVAEEVRRHFPGKVFAAVIPRNVRLSEAPSHGIPVRAYDKFSRGCAAYEQLADEILEKEGV